MIIADIGPVYSCIFKSTLLKTYKWSWGQSLVFNKDSHFILCNRELALQLPSTVCLVLKDSLLPSMRSNFDFSDLSAYLEHFEIVPVRL